VRLMDHHVERFAEKCMSQLLPRYKQYSSGNSAREISSLDLELGDESIWDDPWKGLAQEDDASEDDAIVEEEAFPNDYADAQADTQDYAEHDSSSRPKRPLSAMDLLMDFDPENPPQADDPQALQLWLECAAQQEAVHRYQKLIDNARERKDYSSLSMVQRQVLRWFQPLKDEIASRQKEYVLKESSGNNKNFNKASQRYGPYICALPPEKLAVIVAHEAIMFALLKSGSDGREGVPFISMARRLGEAVEEEVLIHRILHKRFKDGQLDKSKGFEGLDNDDDAPEDVIEGLLAPSTQGDDAPDKKFEDPNSVAATHKWAYASSHLKKYMEELSQYEPSAKKRRVVSYAIRRARQILEKEEWTGQEKVQLGAALFQVLLEKATLDVDGKEEMAFTYEKRWFQKSKIRSYVSLNEGLYKLVVSDKLQSFGATTTKHKPMIMPPTPWTEPNEGGYNWLKVDLMRYHGCNTQKVRSCLRVNNSFALYDCNFSTHSWFLCIVGI